MGYFKIQPRRMRESIRLSALCAAVASADAQRRWPARRRGRRRAYAFVRLAALERHACSGQPTGVFQAAYALKYADDVADHDRDAIVAALDYFERYLRAPRSVREPRAIFWFKPEATEFTRRIWDLAHVLRLHDVPITIATTRRPGKVVYEDEHQIAAIPTK